LERLKNQIPLSYGSKIPRLRTGANREIALDGEFETVEIGLQDFGGFLVRNDSNAERLTLGPPL